jgi:hypothetical protein
VAGVAGRLPWLLADVADISGQDGKSVRDAPRRRLGGRPVQLRGRSVKPNPSYSATTRSKPTSTSCATTCGARSGQPREPESEPRGRDGRSHRARRKHSGGAGDQVHGQPGERVPQRLPGLGRHLGRPEPGSGQRGGGRGRGGAPRPPARRPAASAWPDERERGVDRGDVVRVARDDGLSTVARADGHAYVYYVRRPGGRAAGAHPKRHPGVQWDDRRDRRS